MKKSLDSYRFLVLYLGEMGNEKKKKKRVIDSFPFYKNLMNLNKKGKKQ